MKLKIKLGLAIIITVIAALFLVFFIVQKEKNQVKRSKFQAI